MNLTVAPLLAARMPPPALALVRHLGEIGAQTGMQVYLVGGPVRDLLLGRELGELDFAVEGEVSALVARLEQTHGAQVLMRSQFLTAKLRLVDRTVDVATARRERYPSSGALPVVEPAPIAEDLGRRDFTINAMAIALAPDRFGELQDPLGGQKDLAARTVRVLHRRSFRDDATRILRALRYEQRLQFHLESETEGLARSDAPMLETISPDRLRHELERIFQEAAPERVLARAEELGALAALHPSLRWENRLSYGAVSLRERSQAHPLAYLALLASPLSHQDAQGVASRLNMPAEWAQVVRDVARLPTVLPSLGESLQPSQVEALLKTFVPEALVAALVLEQSRRAGTRSKWLERYLTELRNLRPHLTGDDLLALGVAPGPLVGRMLEGLHRARLDGEVTSREDEVALVRRWLG